MTLLSTSITAEYNGDGSTTVFPVTFVFWDNADIHVIHVDADDNETVWTEATQYNLSGGAGSTGTLTVITSPTDYTPASGERLLIKSNLDDVQSDSLPLSGVFPSTVVEQRLDKITRLIQQQAEEIARAVLLKESSTLSGIELPSPGAGEMIRWNSGGTALETVLPSALSFDTVLTGIATNDHLRWDGAQWVNITPENVSVTPTGATTARTLAARFADVINVKDFGAVGDGSTDDTAAIQAAMNAVPAVGAIVYFPAGTYLVTAQLTSTDKPIYILGQGMFITRIHWKSTAISDGFLITQTDDDYVVFVEDIALLTEKAAVGTALKIDMSGQISGGSVQDRGQPRAAIQNVAVEGATNVTTDGWSVGLHLVDVMHFTVDGFHFQGKRDSVTVTTIDSAEAIKAETTGNAVEAFLRNIWAFHASHGVSINGYEGFVLENFNFVRVTNGVLFTSSTVEPQINIFNGHVNAYLRCIKLTNASQSNISGNTLYMQTDSITNGSGINLENCQYCNVFGNVLVNNSAVNFDAIVLSGTTQGCFVGPNTIQKATAGVWLQGSSQGNRVSAQIFGTVTTPLLDSGTDNQTSWADVYRKTADQTVNNSTTLVDVTSMAAPLSADETVSFVARVRYNSGATPDIKFAFTVPAGGSITWTTANGIRINTAGTITFQNEVSVSGAPVAIEGAGANRWATFEGVVRNGSTPGNLQLQFAQQTADASDTSVLTRSSMTIDRGV